MAFLTQRMERNVNVAYSTVLINVNSFSFLFLLKTLDNPGDGKVSVQSDSVTR